MSERKFECNVSITIDIMYARCDYVINEEDERIKNKTEK